MEMTPEKNAMEIQKLKGELTGKIKDLDTDLKTHKANVRGDINLVKQASEHIDRSVVRLENTVSEYIMKNSKLEERQFEAIERNEVAIAQVTGVVNMNAESIRTHVKSEEEQKKERIQRIGLYVTILIGAIGLIISTILHFI